jgi:transcriptional regulator with XRE-family HTH domain
VNDCIQPQQVRQGQNRPANRQIGARVRDGRLAAGMTQQEVAACLGISYQQMQKYEAGVNSIPASRLYLFSRMFDMPLTFFFEVPFAADQLEFDSREGRTLARIFSQIDDPQKRRHMLALVKTLSEPA